MILGTAGNKGAVPVDTNHSDPVPVTGIGSDTEAGDDLPHLDRLVPRAGDQEIPGRHEGDGGDIVIMTLKCFDTVKRGKVPQLDGHVSGTGGQHLAVGVKGDVLDGVRVTLQSPLKIPGLVLPYLDRGIL